jgi:hypothetical protein
VSEGLAPLLAANGLYVSIGVGLLPTFRIARSWSSLVARLGLGYMVGVATAGIVAAHLALVNVAIGLRELSIMAAVSLALGIWTLVRHGEPASFTRPRPRAGWIVAGGSLIASVVLLGHAARTFAVRPLLEWDGWAIWAMKARALWEFGGAYGPVFTSSSYAPLHLDYPLLFPTLESIAFRVMGRFDGTLVHVQLIALAFGFVAALWSLLYGRVPIEILGLSILALMTAQPLLTLLASNMADIPLAFFVGLGVAGLGRWLVADEGWALVCATLFLGAAMLTKNEGSMFTLAAFLALLPTLVLRERRRLVKLGLALVAIAAIILPWQIFASAHRLKNTDYDLSQLLSWSYLSHQSDRVHPAASELWRQIGLDRWGYIVPATIVALAAALVARRFALASFTVLWLGLSYLGLLAIYWISMLDIEQHLLFSADRTVSSIVLGAGALAPLLAGEALRPWPYRHGALAAPVPPRPGPPAPA